MGAVQTQARMERLWEAWRRHPGSRTLVFCCSIAHATQIRQWLSDQGVRARAVHSGPGADDRITSLEELERGDVDAVCAVDLLNEGVDLPAVDRVVMLRPTGSRVVFLQQLGRGLRTSPGTGKSDLCVIDFVGNHAVFLERVQALLDLGSGGLVSARQLVERRDLEAMLPPGCAIDVEVEALEILERLLPGAATSALVSAYQRFRKARGRRPRPAELLAEGYNPASAQRGGVRGWFGLVHDQGDLDEPEQRTLHRARQWFEELERRMLHARDLELLRRWLEASAPGAPAASVDALEVTPDELASLTDALSMLEMRAGVLRYARPLQVDHLETWRAMTGELVEYLALRRQRLNRRRQPTRATEGFTARVTHNQRAPILMLPDREHHPDIPRGWIDVRLPDGQVWQLKLVKIACNVARPIGQQDNQLGDLMRRWFGPDAGRPGTTHRVRFVPSPDGWQLEPGERSAVARGDGAWGELVAFPTLRAAAGWRGADQPIVEIAQTVQLPLEGLGPTGPDHFAVRVAGDSMDGPDGLRRGDWAILRWSRSAKLGELLGHVALIARRDDDRVSYHLKRIERGETGPLLCSNAPGFEPMPARPGDEVIATLTGAVAPEALAPERHAHMTRAEIAEHFELGEPGQGHVWRERGHLIVLVDQEDGVLEHAVLAPLVEDPAPGEAAQIFFATSGGEDDAWRYHGVGRQRDGEPGWSIPEVDHKLWAAHGAGRGSSRSLPGPWRSYAEAFTAALLERLGEDTIVEGRGKRCRILKRTRTGSVRIDGGEDGFKARSVSTTDLGWVLCARLRARAEGRALVDERAVNELRYLEGTPRSSTRYIDTRCALARSPWLQTVRHLDLRENEIDDDGARALAASPYLRHIERLFLHHNPISERGVEALASANTLRPEAIQMGATPRL